MKTKTIIEVPANPQAARASEYTSPLPPILPAPANPWQQNAPEAEIPQSEKTLTVEMTRDARVEGQKQLKGSRLAVTPRQYLANSEHMRLVEDRADWKRAARRDFEREGQRRRTARVEKGETVPLHGMIGRLVEVTPRLTALAREFAAAPARISELKRKILDLRMEGDPNNPRVVSDLMKLERELRGLETRLEKREELTYPALIATKEALADAAAEWNFLVSREEQRGVERVGRAVAPDLVESRPGSSIRKQIAPGLPEELAEQVIKMERLNLANIEKALASDPPALRRFFRYCAETMAQPQKSPKVTNARGAKWDAEAINTMTPETAAEIVRSFLDTVEQNKPIIDTNPEPATL